MRGLSAVLLLILVAACGPDSGASPSSTAAASRTSSASPGPSFSVTPPPSRLSSGPAPSPGVSSMTCVPGGVISGEPPPADNGPKGACEAARILLPQSGDPCSPSGPTYAASSNCPLYPDLARRLDAQPLSGPGGGANAVCRCQNSWMSATYQVSGPTPDGPTTWSVRVALTFGPSSQETFDVIVQAVASGSLISDIQCGGGGPPTSIFQTPTDANNGLRCS